MDRYLPPEKIGAGVAVCITALLYGTLPLILFVPLNAKGIKKAKGNIIQLKAGGYAIAGSLVLLLTLVTVLHSLSGHI